MKSEAATLTAPRRFEVGACDAPRPAAGEVLVRVEGCGVCGSNLPMWEGREWFTYPQPPGSPGHEAWGVVEDCGEGCNGLTPGQRVAFLSYHGFASHDVAAADAVLPLPEGLSGPFPAEPLACAINVFRRCDIRAGQTVAVIGVGFLGALLVQLASGAGAGVTALSRRPFTEAIARRCGASSFQFFDQADQLADSIDCVIEATGSQSALDLASRMVAVRGRLVIAGYHQDGMRSVNLQQWNWKGIDVINAHERDPAIYVAGMREAMHAVDQGRLKLDGLITHSYPLHRIGEAFESLERRPEGFLKAVVTCGGN